MEESDGRDPKRRQKRVRSELIKQKDKEGTKKWKLNTVKHRKDLEFRLEQLLEENQQLQQRNQQLQQNLEKVKLELELVVEKNKKLLEFGVETKEQIVNNCKNLINNLPPNSPYRRLLLAYLIKGLEMEKVLNIFQISEKSY